MFRYLLACIFVYPFVAHAALEADKLFERLSPSSWVVNVFDREGLKISSGSSVVIGREELVTNCHVLAKGKSITVKRENTQHGATLIHADIDRDLCILRAAGLNAPAVKIASLRTVKIGQRVYAIGAPRGYELTLSDGLVSSFERDANGEIRNIQISVPISPGSSGGGLYDQEGRLVGITTMTRVDAQNLNFALPAEWIQNVPERATKALEAMRSKKTTEAASRSKNDAGATANERQLTGEELKEHLSKFGSVTVKLSSGPEGHLRIGPGSDFEISTNQVGVYSPQTIGSYQLKEIENQICLRPSSLWWSMLQDCYRIYEVSSHKFTMRSITDGFFLAYDRKIP